MSARPPGRLHGPIFMASVRRRLLWPALLGGLALQGCAPAPQRAEMPDLDSWHQRKAELTHLEGWRLDGRVAVSAGEDGWSGALTWRQRADALELNVRGPLGVGGFRASGVDGRMRVVTSDGETIDMRDPESELAERYGWSVPVGRMRYWILGIPAPQTAADEQIDRHGRAELLEQDGWQVSYDRYVEFDGHVVPRRLELRRDDVRVRIVVDRWRIDSA